MWRLPSRVHGSLKRQCSAHRGDHSVGVQGEATAHDVFAFLAREELVAYTFSIMSDGRAGAEIGDAARVF
jgi:hypothetical protein